MVSDSKNLPSVVMSSLNGGERGNLPKKVLMKKKYLHPPLDLYIPRRQESESEEKEFNENNDVWGRGDAPLCGKELHELC